MKLLNWALMTLSTIALPLHADWKPLWPGEPPGGTKPNPLKETPKDGARLTDILTPEYQVFLPNSSRRTGAAVVILPGGGYTGLAMGHEGIDYAEWLMKRGVVAVLVKYRVTSNDAAGYQFPVPLMDARRAIRLTRSMARDWSVDPTKVGVMGSSAGGHLASMCATLWDQKIPQETNDEIDTLGCRPDFAILVYPVITMVENWSHSGSKRRLIGSAPSTSLAESLSTDRRVTSKTPPCFLIHAADDSGVPVRNSLEFSARCAENKVPVVCHVFANGGHGFGLKGKGDSAAWPPLLASWLSETGLAHADE